MLDSNLLTVADAARLLRLSYSRASNLASKGELGPIHREGFRVLVERAEVEKFADGQAATAASAGTP